MAEQFSRTKEGYRFEFGGMKVNTAPDRMPPNKYPLAVNIRGYTMNSVRTRPGQLQKFIGAGSPGVITDMRAFSDLFTDDLPRILARDSKGQIYLDTGALEYTMMAGATNLGVSMIPFRSNQSTSPQMYIGSSTDYVKIPSPGSGVAVSKAGIAEPQQPPDAVLLPPLFQILGDPNVSAGTAGGSATGARTTDTVVASFQWPGPAATRLYSVQVGASIQYQRFQNLLFAGSNPGLVQDVFQQFTQSLMIEGIVYFSGATGRCIVVPAGLGAAPGNEGTSIYSANVLTGLRRGTLIKIGAEVCFVLSVTTGPDGSVSIETSTTAHHTTADLLTSVPSISVMMLSGAVPSGSIGSTERAYQVTAGIGTITTGGFGGILVNQSFQPDDNISFAVKVDNLLNLNEIKILLDVGDGSFTQNFYYYVLRPSDIASGVGNVLTQIASAQQIIQRAIIDEEDAAAARNQKQTSSSAQTVPGSNQWSQILIPINSFTRVGSDQTATLQQITKIQFLYNANATINVQHGTNDLYMVGGSQPDVGDIGAPLLYRVRPRSAASGAKGNPSPATRYGTNPRRQPVIVTMPSAAYDPQIDTWDIFRYGGSITSWRYVGSITAFGSPVTFTDNFSDDAVNAGDELEFDNFEPWPTVGLPNTNTATQVCGTLVIVNSTDTSIVGYLPGTLIQIGTINVYTLRNRPVLLSFGTYQIELEENAGAGINLPFTVQEPALANRHLPYLFGPDAAGTVFGVGDQFRPGTLNFAKNYAPDSVPDSYNLEITPPSEPLLGGEILDGLAFVASGERWWALYPQPQNPQQRYNVVQVPVLRGLAAPFAHCNDGVSVYSWAKDGIYSSTKGSLTDEDLYTLFPHEGVKAQDYVYNGVTIPAPDYSRAATFRLSFANSYLYATYQTAAGVYQTLVFNTVRDSWSFDTYSPGVSAFYHPEQQAGTLLVNGTRYDELLMGTVTGVVAIQQDLTNDIGGPITGRISTFEYDGGDARAGEQWGDIFLDSTPAAFTAVVATAMFLSAPTAPPITLAVSTTRVQQPVSIGGQELSDFLGLQLVWTDDFTHQSVATSMHLWQPSFLLKPETIADRISDWDDGGVEGAKWVQGFVMHADTFNAVKGLNIQDADTLTNHPFTPAVQHNGESEIAYSFNTPFIAHMMRLVPTDQILWRFWEVRWVVQETPETAETWQTQASTFGMVGFLHVRQISLTYSSSQPVTVTLTAYDGTSPAPLVFPATGGAVQKIVLVPTFNKGQLYTIKASSSAPFQIYVDKSEVMVGQWARTDSYVNKPLVGETGGDRAEI